MVEINNLMSEHFGSKTLVIAERYTFWRAEQDDCETVNEFMMRLRKLSGRCEFGPFLKEALRDKFVGGLKSDLAGAQRTLLTEKNVTLERAIELATAQESARAEQKKILSENVHKLSTRGSRDEVKPAFKVSIKCYRCNGNHEPSMCKFSSATCYNCGKKGHIQTACRKPRAGKPIKNVNSLDDSDKTIGDINYVSPIFMRVAINSINCQLEVDTGSPITLLKWDTFQKIGGSLKQTDEKFRGYEGSDIDIKGIGSVIFRYGDKERWLKVYVTNGKGSDIIGRDWLEALCHKWPLEVKNINNPNDLDDIIKKYEEVFSKELGKLRGIKATIPLKVGATPIFHKHRRISIYKKEMVESKLDRLVQEGVLKPVRFSKWATPIVAVEKKGGGVRLCADFSVTLNPHLSIDCYPLPRIEEIMSTLAGGKDFTVIDLANAYLQMEEEAG